jgi:hypothetical protein
MDKSKSVWTGCKMTLLLPAKISTAMSRQKLQHVRLLSNALKCVVPFAILKYHEEAHFRDQQVCNNICFQLGRTAQ